MYYICIENDLIKSVLNYEPNAPVGVTVIPISDEEYNKLFDKTYYFDVTELKFKEIPQEEIDTRRVQLENSKNLNFLNLTDWKVLRHIRQKALGISTTLTDEEYIELETSRQAAAEAIIRS